MERVRDEKTRYFIEINLKSLKITKCGYDQKENLDKGRQNDPDLHRLFLTVGQYNTFVARCASQLGPILET